MKKKEGEQNAKLIRCGMELVLGGVAALAVCFVFLLVTSAAISGELAGEELMYQFTIMGCVPGASAGGLLAVRRCGSRTLIVGLTTGGVFFLLLLTIGALCFETVSLEAGGIGLLYDSLCGGAAAGTLGSGDKKKPARRKRRKRLKSGGERVIVAPNHRYGREARMKHVKTLNGATLKRSAAHGGCGKCQTSCQSACKTPCTVANQKRENQ